MATIRAILTEAMDRGASDIHVIAGKAPLFRVNTVLDEVEGFEPVMREDCERFIRTYVGDDRYQAFQKLRDVDFSASFESLGRFRVNAHYQRNSLAMALRAIPDNIPPIATLNLPPIVESLTDLPSGLVLITGPTGSGKSTTLAAMIDAMNHRFQHHVITMEDPIEYEFRSDRCLIEQREVGIDLPNFASGLRHALRQDPDVLLVGEMRDLETSSAAITAAETGHLVLSTLHTSSAALTIERIVDIYPGAQQNQIRTMLANTLQAVVSISLFQRVDVDGMIPACEVMMCTPAVRNCIRENRIHEISNIIVTSRRIGMCSKEDSIRALYANGRITREQAMAQGVTTRALDSPIGV